MRTSEILKCLLEEPKKCHELRKSHLYQTIQHFPLTFEELHPIFTFLEAKAKYPKTHPKYQEIDERRVLTSRLAKLLKKLEAGKMLTREEKTQKHPQNGRKC